MRQPPIRFGKPDTPTNGWRRSIDMAECPKLKKLTMPSVFMAGQEVIIKCVCYRKFLSSQALNGI